MKTFELFAKEIGFNLQMLDNYITFADKYYKSFYVSKKKKTKKREIDSPSKELKGIQRWVLHNYFNNIELSKRANGFIKNRGIKRHARFHLGKQFILTIDIKDFFPSISQKMVYDALSNYFDDNRLLLKLSKLCTYKRYLPQGAPTSPFLSNLVFLNIDEEISSYCNSKLINYSRYADDLVFSSDNKNSLVESYSFVNKILVNNSFIINKSKTRYLSGKGALKITGININDNKLTVSKDLKRKVRSMFHKFIIKNDKSVNINSAIGYMSFIKDIEPEYYAKLIRYIQELNLKKTLSL
jgi:retron-type reverse transcriptase